MTIEGVLYKLIDTAGIRSSTSDRIEQMGIDKSIEKIEQADIVIALFDASATTAKQIIDWQTAIGNDKMILVGNKVDLGIDPSLQNNEALKEVIFIAAKDKKNIEALRTMLTQKVVGDGFGGGGGGGGGFFSCDTSVKETSVTIISVFSFFAELDQIAPAANKTVTANIPIKAFLRRSLYVFLSS